MLCYALGWVTGLIFYLIDKRPIVRFHAAQSMIVFGALQIIAAVVGHMPLDTLTGFSIEALDLLGIALGIVLMVKAYQGERFMVPTRWS